MGINSICHGEKCCTARVCHVTDNVCVYVCVFVRLYVCMSVCLHVLVVCVYVCTSVGHELVCTTLVISERAYAMSWNKAVLQSTLVLQL